MGVFCVRELFQFKFQVHRIMVRVRIAGIDVFVGEAFQKAKDNMVDRIIRCR